MDRLTAMRVFDEVVELGSLAAAADKLDMSRAMVTRYVAELEKWLGVRLLHRSTRSLSLTTAGRNALPHCQQMLALADGVQLATQTPNAAPSGLIRVAAAISLGYAYLAKACSRYTVSYPGTAVELVLGDSTVNLVEARIDLAVRITAEPDSSLIARKLGVCRSVMCASPGYLMRHGTPDAPQDLAQHNCLRYTNLGDVWRFKSRGSASGTEHAVEVSGNFGANDATVLLQAALADAGLSRLPTYIAAQHIEAGTLVHVLANYDMDEMGLYALYSSRRYLPATTRTLVDFLAEELSPQPPWDRFLSQPMDR